MAHPKSARTLGVKIKHSQIRLSFYNLSITLHKPHFSSSSSAHATIPLQDQLALMEQLPHRPRHLGFALDLLDVEILGVLVRPL
jgi:hypothetical protein